MRISDWSSDVCSSDLIFGHRLGRDGWVRRHCWSGCGGKDWRSLGQPRRCRVRVRPGYRRAAILSSNADGYALPKFFRRSEEHTSELQSLMRISYAVFCLKKKKTYTAIVHNNENRSVRTSMNRCISQKNNTHIH